MTTCRWTLRAAALAAAITAFACARAPRHPDVLTIEPIQFAAPAGSSLPNLSAFGEPAILSWVETSTADAAASEGSSRATLKFAQRTGNGWSEPRTVAAGSDWFVNSADVPSVVRLDGQTLVAHWLQNTDVHLEAYDIHMSWSSDGGATWSAPVMPHHDGTKTQHGFATLFPMPGTRLGVVWLDGRATADPENDNMSIRAATFDRTGHQESESLVDDRVCECCPTAAAATAEGAIAVYRDRSAAEVRDIAAARLVNGAWMPSTLVHADNWKIEACPVNGPAVSVRDRDVAVAWMTADGEQGHAYAAFSSDGGATFGAPIRLDETGSLGRVGIALVDASTAYATWIEFSSGTAQLLTRRIDRSGGRGPTQIVTGLGGDRASGYPRIARNGGELLFAWTEIVSGQPRVRTAAARSF